MSVDVNRRSLMPPAHAAGRRGTRREKRLQREAYARARRRHRVKLSVGWLVTATVFVTWYLLFHPSAAVLAVVAGWVAFAIIVWLTGRTARVSRLEPPIDGTVRARRAMGTNDQ
jgi:hypothetical protein